MKDIELAAGAIAVLYVLGSSPGASGAVSNLSQGVGQGIGKGIVAGVEDLLTGFQSLVNQIPGTAGWTAGVLHG